MIKTISSMLERCVIITTTDCGVDNNIRVDFKEESDVTITVDGNSIKLSQDVIATIAAASVKFTQLTQANGENDGTV